LSQLNANDSLEGGCRLERIELIAFSLQSHRAMLGVGHSRFILAGAVAVVDAFAGGVERFPS
jgi:hypothetical protein